MMNDDNIGRGRMLPPLPERMRPQTLDGYFGQTHLIGQGCILRNMIESGNLSSFILWGPPGVGKTTLSRIVAKSLGREFYTLSAVSAVASGAIGISRSEELRLYNKSLENS